MLYNTKDYKNYDEFNKIQNDLVSKTELVNRFNMEDIKVVSGVDLAYWQKDNKDYAVCCFVTVDSNTHEVLEKKHFISEVSIPYVAGYLSFRELPLILETYKLLEIEPDIVIFDGNGYLHYRNMGIATHASFYLNKPTIGVAKTYLKIDNVDFDMPDNYFGAYSDIIINKIVYGRALRTRKDVKPIFVSCGNWIDIDTSTNIVLNLTDKNSRQPIPTRLADIETRYLREKFM